MNVLTLIDPRFWLVIAFCCAGSFLMGNGTGYAKATKAAELREARITLEAQTKLAAATERAAAIERQARADIAAITTRHEKDKANAQAKNDRLIADVRAGARRVSVPVIRPLCPAAAGADPSAAGRLETETRAELTGQAFEDLNRLAVEGDEAIMRANACADAYETIRRTTLNSPGTP